MAEFLRSFAVNINGISNTEKQKNEFFGLCCELIKMFHSFSKNLNEENSNRLATSEVLDLAYNFVSEKLHLHSSAAKRQKLVESSDKYVEPKEYMLGTHWEMKKVDSENNQSIPKLLGSKFHFVHITETIRALFKNEHFRRVYLEYNKENSVLRHKCVPEVFKDFCCGSVFQNNELYQKYPNSLQIKIFSDDFGVTNPLGPRATTHKLYGMYFTIQNLPKQYLSKVENTFLICLAHSDDLKTKETDHNDLWRLVLEDVRYLETEGVDIGDGIVVRGSISYLTFDNLGGSQCLGLAESSQAIYFCRICKMPKCDCQTVSEEDPSVLRTLDDYKRCLTIIENSTKVDFKESLGIKRYCVLNDLKYFNIFINKSVDPLHDLNEGTIPFLLRHFFSLLISLKIVNESTLQQKFQFFDYGFLQTKNVPALVDIKKGSLNQTGSQIMCLFRHTPFVLYEFKDHSKLKSAWKCVQSLLRVSQIVHSTCITYEDIQFLKDFITEHLELIQTVFGTTLINKHHMLVHYPNLIVEMGPVIFMSTMRGESKNQDLKRIISSNRNFVNITKTIVNKHQARLAQKSDTFCDEIKTSKKCKQEHMNDEDKQLVEIHFDSSHYTELDWLQINNFHYKRGLFLLKEDTFYRIERIFHSNLNYIFLCVVWKKEKFDCFLNSVEIKELAPIVKVALLYSELNQKKLFEAKRLNNTHYIIADTLDVTRFN